MSEVSKYQKFNTPVYIYSKDQLSANYKLLEASFPYQHMQIHYAVMCNNNKDVLREIRKLGGSVQVNSLNELELVKDLGFDKRCISFTSIGLDKDSLRHLINEGVQLNLDSIEEVEKLCQLTSNYSFGIRVNIKDDIILNKDHTNSYKHSDVGIKEEDFKRVTQIARQASCKINGVHGYLASNILDTAPCMKFGDYLGRCASSFKDLEYLNFGSGFGVFCECKTKHFDFETIGRHYANITEDLSTNFNRDIQLKIEPGRSIVASAGILLAKVTNIKQLQDKKQVAIDVGFGGFARPILYNACHLIEVLGKENGAEHYDVRAATVLQSDFIGRDRYLPLIEENDIVVIHNAGAYGMVMASGFPGRKKPEEIMMTSFADLL